MRIKSVLARTPLISSLMFFFYRLKTALAYFVKPLSCLFVWLFRSKETTNFTYDLTQSNKHYLAALIADVTNKSFDEINKYIVEIEEDDELKQHIKQKIKENKSVRHCDETARYGRRIGWYAFVRALKPKIVVETGIDKGLGACVLSSALMRNAKEGFHGHYYGTDINPHAGFLLAGKYQEFGTILYGDSIQSLEKLDKQIDVFINDSDHSPDYEEREYQAIKDKLSLTAIVLGDNAHCTDKLLNFSRSNHRQFVYFAENPHNHWYAGCGIGISFKRNKHDHEN